MKFLTTREFYDELLKMYSGESYDLTRMTERQRTIFALHVSTVAGWPLTRKETQ